MYSKNGHDHLSQFSAEINSIYLSVVCRMESGYRVIVLYEVVDLVSNGCCLPIKLLGRMFVLHVLG